jgi:hypothetical protein
VWRECSVVHIHLQFKLHIIRAQWTGWHKSLNQIIENQIPHLPLLFAFLSLFVFPLEMSK